MIVGIYLRGDALDPDKISEILGVSPSRWQRKGEPKAGSERFIAKLGLWALIAQIESNNVDEHIDELLGKLRVAKQDLGKLEGVERADLDIFVATEEQGDRGTTIEMVVSNPRIAAINDLGLSINITVS